MKKEKPLSSGAWLRMFLLTILMLGLLIALFNIITDPYGAFGDHIFHWWEYDESRNPKVAKMAYLEQHHTEYDSYIVGSSGSSSYPIDALNKYLDANFYNCFFYGTDAADYEDVCMYLLEHYTVKHLLLNLCTDIAYYYDTPNTGLTGSQYWRVNHQNPFTFYSKYLFADPADGWMKLKYYFNDSYVVQQPYRVFETATGSYDKSRRDAEPIHELEEYLNRDAYKGFKTYPSEYRHVQYLNEAIEAVSRIREACISQGVDLIVTCQPAYWEAASFYTDEDHAAFRNALASVTDYWDFTLSSVSYEPRYFYDLTHFRNSVGSMALARIFEDKNMYVPSDFGEYVPIGSTPGGFSAAAVAPDEYSETIPILVYHHLTEENADNTSTITVSVFEEQMQALVDNGWETVGFGDLYAYVYQGISLPEKTVLLTFDDGYSSNYLLAYPILQKYGLKATIFPVGVSMGRDTYKDTGESMIPHFSVTEGEEMQRSGVIELQSHGYDVHEVSGRDPDPIRVGALPREDETEIEYAAFMKEDCAKMRGLLGGITSVFAYPYGQCSELTEIVLRNEGFYATLTIEQKHNLLIKGLPQSLLQLGRYTVTDDMTGKDLLLLLDTE